MKYFSFFAFLSFAATAMVLSSCSKDKSATTGWDYNNPKNGGFQVAEFEGQMTGPGLLLVEGGTFTMGANYDDPQYEWNNSPRRVTVKTFYMDETEVANVDYLEYLYWINRVFGTDYPEVYRKALPIHWSGVTAWRTMNLWWNSICAIHPIIIIRLWELPGYRLQTTVHGEPIG